MEVKPKLKNVTLIEEADPSIMPRLYNCADFYISTSPCESFGLSSCEALACDLPIITFKTGWAWDFWDKRLGLRVDKWDTESFANAIKELVPTIKKNLGTQLNPRQAIIEKGFTKEVMEKNWKNYIKEVLNKNGTKKT